jgi:hypothetical protein
MIAQNDTAVTDQIVALVSIVVGLIVVVVAILVIAWLSSIVARLLDWRRRGHWERRR